MNADVSKGKDTISEEKTINDEQQSPEVKEEIESTTESFCSGDVPETLEIDIPDLLERVIVLEGFMDLLLKRINVKDEPVKIPPKSNHNPDYLPTGGGEPKDLDELPPRKG